MSEQDPAVHRTRRHRFAAALVVAVAAILAVSAFRTTGPSPADQDQGFVQRVAQQGRVVPTGDQQALLVSAAHKICDRQGAGSATALARRHTALKPEEIEVVQQTFGDDTSGFVKLALDTYCPD
jgi:uncharacterized protein (DUF2267 family)